MTQPVAGRALGIVIYQNDGVTRTRQFAREVDRNCRLAAAALEIDDGDNNGCLARRVPHSAEEKLRKRIIEMCN
jgi:hypothetical protein